MKLRCTKIGKMCHFGPPGRCIRRFRWSGPQSQLLFYYDGDCSVISQDRRRRRHCLA